MNRLIALWLALCLVPGLALGAQAAALETVPPETETWPRLAVAAAQQEGDTVPLFAEPDDSSEVLMAYYRGARLTALRRALPGYVQVQAGTAQAGLLGYMREEDLRFDSAALREIQPEYVMILLNRETPIYAGCDELAEVIGTCSVEQTYYTIGKNDGKWVQLYAPTGSYVGQSSERFWAVREGEGAAEGFVLLSTGLARGYECAAVRWEVEPIPGEITRAQAVELAVTALMTEDNGMPGEMRSEAFLRGLDFETAWWYSVPDSGFVSVGVDVTYECDAYTLHAALYPDGTVRTGTYQKAAEGS